MLVILLEIGLAVIGAGGDHVQTHEARSVHRDSLGERADMVCHILACGLALHIGVRQDGEDAVHAGRDVVGDRAVACGIDVRHAGGGVLVDEDAAVDLAACLGGKLGVRTDADRYDENIEIDRAAALEVRLVRLELCHRVAEQEFYALTLDVLLDDGRRDLGQNVRQDARREVDDGQLGNTLIDALGALQADEARADDEHALVVRLAEHFVQMLRVVERHEARFVLDRVQTLHRGNERA